MIVRFDSLNRFEPPKFYLCNPGSVYDGGKLSNVVGILPDTHDEELVLNFNAISELNFRVYKDCHIDSNTPAEIRTAVRDMYFKLQNRRMIFVDDIGYFVITSVTTGFDGIRSYKDIHAESCEVEIQNKNIPYIENGTYRFVSDITGAEIGILNIIESSLPLWTVDYDNIPDAIEEKFRTFEDVDVELNCLGFLLENVQDAYECIFMFDCADRVIHVFDQNNYALPKDIHLTKDDIINSLDVVEDSANLYTAINVLGDNDLTINAVNPLGTSTIYNFDYYLDWMSPELSSKVGDWKSYIESIQSDFDTKSERKFAAQTEQYTHQLDIDKLTTRLTMYRRCLENLQTPDFDPEHSSEDYIKSELESYNAVIRTTSTSTETESSVIEISGEISELKTAINTLITEAGDELATAQGALSTVEAEIASIDTVLIGYHDTAAIEHYFVSGSDTHLLDELSNYIYEGSYRDEYITITESMTNPEIFEQMKTLYDRAVAQLTKVSQPKQEFSMDVENFLFVKEFERWSNQIETGCLINVELDADDVAALFLSNMTVNYQDNSLSLTFGNRFNKTDPKSLFEDALGDIQKSSNSLNYIKEAIYPIRNGVLGKMQEEIRNARTLTKDAVLASRDQEVVIDDTGYTGRRKNGDGTYDGHQIKITGENIVFTDDAWETSKLALGSMVLPSGTGTGTGNEVVYGINAEAIIGEMIIGGNLKIYSESDDGERTALFDVVDGMVKSEVTSQTAGYSTSISQNEEQIRILVNSLDDVAPEGDDGERAVSKVRTATGYTFDEDGLTISQSGSEINNLLNNEGMYVRKRNGDTEEDVLVADTEGVKALNLRANKYLIIDNHARFEEYNPTGNVHRMACYWISNDGG